VSEGIKKIKGEMPSSDLPNNGNVWQTSELVRLAKKVPASDKALLARFFQ